MMSTRPVSAWAAAGTAAYRVDPARTYLPGRRSRLSWALMASRSSGTCWYSSIRTGSLDSTNRPGSAPTADPVAGSAQADTGRLSPSANWLRRVLLPTVRGPLRTSTGSSAKRVVATSTRRRFARPVRTSRMTVCYLAFSRIPGNFFRVSGLRIPFFRQLDSANTTRANALRRGRPRLDCDDKARATATVCRGVTVPDHKGHTYSPG